MDKTDSLYDVSIVYPSYTRKIRSVCEPRISDEGGVPMLLTMDVNGKVWKFNMNKVERYDYATHNERSAKQ